MAHDRRPGATGVSGRTVRHLQDLYSVLIALALARGIQQLSNESSGINWSPIELFIALLVTLVPFYHGALRHLEHDYVEQVPLRSWLLLGDFAVLFVEGCTVFILAGAVGQPVSFTWALIVLLGVDVVWVAALLGARRLLTPLDGGARPITGGEVWWMVLNAATIVVLVVAVRLVPATEGSQMLERVVLGVAVARTVLDYALAWPLYFPREGGDGPPSAHGPGVT